MSAFKNLNFETLEIDWESLCNILLAEVLYKAGFS